MFPNTHALSSAPAPQKKRFVFVSLTLCCLLADVALLAGIFEAARWLIDTLSPFALIGVAIATVLTARMALFVYAGLRNARSQLDQATAS